jgi:uncharacterized protein (DUF433 family)
MKNLLSRITSSPEICHGKPCIRGLRYPIETLLELLSSGMTHREILDDYEDLEEDDLRAAIAWGARLVTTKRIEAVKSETWKRGPAKRVLKHIALLLLTVCNLVGCSQGYMTVVTNGTTTVYSKFYDQGVWLITDKLGLVVAIDDEKKAISGVSGVQQSVGALGRSDSIVSGKVTVYLWNFDGKPHSVKFKKFTVPTGFFDCRNQVVEAAAHDRTGVEFGQVPIFSYGTKIDCSIELEIAGSPKTIELTLPRRTVPELQQFFGTGGTRPYPWKNRRL